MNAAIVRTASAMRPCLVLTICTAMVLVFLTLIAAPAMAAKARFFEEAFGSAAEPNFVKPQGIAIDQVTDDLLVIDAAGKSVSRYHQDGTPAPFASLGTNVIDGKKGPGGKECVEEASSCDATPEGGLKFGNSGESQIAVDSSGGVGDGNIYVTYASAPHVIQIFAGDGRFLGQLTEAGSAGLGEPCGVAVGPSGEVYVGDYAANQVHKFIPSASPVKNIDNVANFSVEHPCTVAVGSGPSAGAVFATTYNGRVSKLDALTGEVKYTVAQGGNIAVSSKNKTLAVDGASGHVLVARGSEVTEYDASGEAGAVPIAPPIKPGSGVEGVAVYAGGRLALSREAEPHLETYGPLVEVPPRIEAQWTAAATNTEATVIAQVGPAEEETSYQVEYGTSPAYGQTTAVQEVGNQRTLTVRLVGLEPSMRYHWRFVASDPAGTTEGDDRVVFTHGAPAVHGDCPRQSLRLGPSAHLSDCRAYEMVSPVDKNGGDIDAYYYEGLDPAMQFAGVDVAAIGGDKLAYTASTAFAGAEGSAIVSEYLSARGESGWSTRSIDPAEKGGVANSPGNIDSQYKAFSSDLRAGWLVPESGLPLVSGPTAGWSNLYRRDNSTGAYTWLESSAPEPEACPEPATETACFLFPELQGVSADGRSAVFRVNDDLNDESIAGEGELWQLYLWSEAQGLRLLSRLPNGEPVNGDSSAGTESQEYAPLFNSAGRTDTVDNALSADGTKVYWTVQGEAPRVFLRVNADQPQSAVEEVSAGNFRCTEPKKACTVRVSPGALLGQFWTASPDGEEAIISTHTFGTIEGSLYRYAYDEATGKGETSEIAPETVGVLGASEDLSHVYFSSRADLAAGATAGDPNLYLDHEGAVTYLGALAEEDVSEGGVLGHPSPVASVPRSHIAQVTPDGRHVAFVSASAELARQVAGYDNTDAVSGRPDREVYVYSVGGAVRCASCNPTGARPQGADLKDATGIEAAESLWTAAWIPSDQIQLYGRRRLSDDGTRLFFNSVDPLSLRDVNDAQDVYEWELPGAGDCAASSPSYSPQNGGCVNLISSGQSPRDSEFVDASASGDDIFIRTESSLVPADPGAVDIYDARVDGGFPEADEAPPCEGDSCQRAPLAPSFEQPSSRGYRGPGDPSLNHLNCKAFGHRAARLARRAKRLRRASRQAARVGKAKRARLIHRRSLRLGKRARRVSRHAKHCRRANRRAAR